MVADNPSRGLLTRIGDHSPFGVATWEKRRIGAPLVFYVEAAARASSPIWNTFSANRLENFAVSDVCNWQIILMVISSAKRAIVKRTSSIPHGRCAMCVIMSIRMSDSFCASFPVSRIHRFSGTKIPFEDRRWDAIVGIRLNSIRSILK